MGTATGDDRGAGSAPRALAAELVGEDTGRPPLVLLHGFTQNRRCWGPIAEDLGRDRHLLAVDLPGHGESAAAGRASVDESAALLDATVRKAFAGDVQVDVLGYSMGGRIGLAWLSAHPERIRRIVTIGATAGIEGPDARAARRDQDEARARRLETEGMDAFLDWWLGLELFAGLPEWARFDRQRRSNTVEGLAASLRHAGTGSMPPLWSGLAERRDQGVLGDSLVLTGASDDRFLEVGTRLGRCLGGRSETVAGAGHAAHLEAPESTAALVRAALDDTAP